MSEPENDGYEISNPIIEPGYFYAEISKIEKRLAKSSIFKGQEYFLYTFILVNGARLHFTNFPKSEIGARTKDLFDLADNEKDFDRQLGRKFIVRVRVKQYDSEKFNEISLVKSMGPA